MRILLYGLNYSPEPTGIGRYTGELVRCLASHGHSLRVITAPPYYPFWHVERPYRNWFSKHDEGGVTVYRCPLWVPHKPRGITRLAHLASFALSSLAILLCQRSWQPDVVITVAPAFFCTPGALLFSRLSRCRSLLHIQDFELDAAFELSLLRGSWIRRLAQAGESCLLRGFDRVTTISQGMRQKLLLKGVADYRCGLLPNWVDTSRIYPLNRPSHYRDRLGIPPEAMVCLYSGSMNRKQGLDLLAKVARELQDLPDLYWVFCGNGPSRADLEESCIGLKRVRFLDLQPDSELNELLNLADIHLLPQKAGATDLVMPSKLLGILASGRPVITTSTPGSELASVCTQAGVVVEPENAAAFEQALRALLAEPNQCQRLGTQGRALVEAQWSHEKVLSNFESQLGMLFRFDISNFHPLSLPVEP